MAPDIYDQLPESAIFLIPARLEEFKAMPTELQDIHPADLFSDYEAGFKNIHLKSKCVTPTQYE
jgi:hypothetical protein